MRRARRAGKTRRVLSWRQRQGRKGMANITEVPVRYKDSGGTELNGYLVHDADKTGRRPGVLVFHEWWGITEHVRNEARYFAGLGYSAFVADLYGGRTADNPEDAGA